MCPVNNAYKYMLLHSTVYNVSLIAIHSSQPINSTEGHNEWIFNESYVRCSEESIFHIMWSISLLSKTQKE